MKTKLFVALTAIALIVVTASSASAHEHRGIGDLSFVVGFMNEPAIEGVPNGVSIRVTKVAEHSHENDHEAMEGGAMDVEEHGAIFNSPALGHDESFEFEITHALEGLIVPFHNHLNHDMTGMITVDENASQSGRVDIEIHDGMYMPADLTVQPGTLLVFTNTSENPQGVTSGIMTDDHNEGEEDSHDEAEMVAVEGLQDTLQVEVTHVASNVSMTKPLGTVFGDTGHYKTDFIPTAPGAYKFRFFGSIEGIEINETFESGPNTFSTVEAASELHFPETISAAREIEGAARGAQSSAQEAQTIAAQAQSAASSASAFGIIGIVVGVIGILVGAGAGVIAMRKQS